MKFLIPVFHVKCYNAIIDDKEMNLDLVCTLRFQTSVI